MMHSSLPRPSRWFLSCIAALIIILALAIVFALALTLRQNARLRSAMISGSSMEPTLHGPRVITKCPACKRDNQWTSDTWIANRELKCQFCNEYVDNSNVEHLPGQTITYVPTLLVNQKGLLPQGAPRSTLPVHRWELAVIRNKDDELGQVKRVVGLPGEQVSIKDGRIWINGNRILPSPTAFLHQAIPVANWTNPATSTNSNNTTSVDEFLSSISFPIANNLPINAFDSHQIIPALDVGIALQLRTNEPSWNLHLTFQIDEDPIPIEVSTYERTTTIHIGSVSMASLPKNWILDWLQFLILGDTLVILDAKQELGRMPLETFVESHRRVGSKPLNASRVRWTKVPLIDPTNLLKRVLIYRGRIYRGANDSNSQDFPANDGWVVLGDNVSISDDSRTAEASSVRIQKQQLQGVLPEPPSLMHNLLQP
jgi:signal peptidase I